MKEVIIFLFISQVCLCYGSTDSPPSMNETKRSPKSEIVFVSKEDKCRGPMAAAIYAKVVQDMNDTSFSIHSAGIHVEKAGEKCDKRVIQFLSKKKINLFVKDHKSKKFVDKDFYKYDFIMAVGENEMKKLQASEPKSDPKSAALCSVFEFDDDQKMFNDLCERLTEEKLEEFFLHCNRSSHRFLKMVHIDR